MESELEEEKTMVSKKEKEFYLMNKENEFLEKKVKELKNDILQQIDKINEELKEKNQNIGKIYEFSCN